MTSNYQQQKIVKTQALDLELIQRYQQEILGSKSTGYGNIKSDNIIVEFVDYNCGHCKQMINTVKALALSTNNIKVIVKDLPVLGISSENAARAAIAASKQGQYLAYQEYLLATKLPYSEDNLVSIANRLKLDQKQFIKDYQSLETKTQIAANRSLAKKLMITATPSIVVTNKSVTLGKIIPGALNTEQLKAIMQANSNNQ